MNHIGSIILILVCVGIGYVLEPVFFQKPAQEAVENTENSVGDDKKSSDLTTSVATQPATITEPQAELDLDQLVAADYPIKVTLNSPYSITDSANNSTIQLDPGAKVKPLRVEGDQLIFQPVGWPVEGKTALTNTNFIELAAALQLKRLATAQPENSEENSGDTDSSMAGDSEPTAEPGDATETAPAAVEADSAVTQKEPEAIADPEPMPTPPSEPTEPVSTESLNEVAVIALMKASVENEQVKEFKANQVISWNAGEPLEFDGKNYQTGKVTFKATSILGEQEHSAIALIENGIIVKWIWAKHKLEMR